MSHYFQAKKQYTEYLQNREWALSVYALQEYVKPNRNCSGSQNSVVKGYNCKRTAFQYFTKFNRFAVKNVLPFSRILNPEFYLLNT